MDKCISRWPTARRILWTLLPSFVSAMFGHGDVLIDEVDTTSYLNGLRGIASLVVALQHNTNEYFPANHRGWGDLPEDYSWIQLPFLRLILSGSFMVAIFFVISGFALTYSPLEKMHANNHGAALESLPSSVFRRPVRLFIPILPVLLISGLMIQMRVFYALGSEDMLPAQSDILAEIWLTMQQFIRMLSTNVGTPTMPQGWTIATEYQGSILMFLCCLAFGRVVPWIRMALVTGIFGFHMYIGSWELALFMVGMLLADVRHFRAQMPEMLKSTRRRVAMISWIVFGLSLFLGGWPIYGDGDKTLGFSYFAWIPTGNVPQQRFWHSASAIMLVSSLENLPMLQKWLNAKPILYLGEISYGLYLVHWMIGMNVLTKGTIIKLRSQGTRPILAWAAGIIISLPLCIWAADLHWRLVDRKSVRLARWLSDKCGI